VNHLVFQGLKRYGFDAVAAELAAASAELFLGCWRGTGLARENFDSRTGEGGGRRHQSWGSLLGLIALEELADVTPWEGLRVGGLRPCGPLRLRGLVLRGRRWDVELGPDFLRVHGEGLPGVSVDAPAVLRRLELDAHGLSAEVHLERPARLEVEVTSGSLVALVDGMPTTPAGRAVALPAGRHGVVVRRR
jgi:putative isomerase